MPLIAAAKPLWPCKVACSQALGSGPGREGASLLPAILIILMEYFRRRILSQYDQKPGYSSLRVEMGTHGSHKLDNGG